MWLWILSCPICLVNPQLQLRITSHPTSPLTPNIVFPCYSAPSKKKAEQVLESIEGFSIADEQKARIKIIREHHDFIEEMIATVDTRVNEMVAKYEGNINLLCTIPGIDRRSAITIISEIGTDMGQFGSSKRLCCWAGLTPGNNESAGKRSLCGFPVPVYT